MNFKPKINTLYRYKSGIYFIIRKIEDRHIEVDHLDISTSTLRSNIVDEWGETKHKFKKVKDVKIKTKIRLRGLI
jgi:hypothetical protein